MNNSEAIDCLCETQLINGRQNGKTRFQEAMVKAVRALRDVDKLTLELNETYMDDYGTTWVRPTAEAYALTCKALDKKRIEIERLQEENKMLKKNLAECAGY